MPPTSQKRSEFWCQGSPADNPQGAGSRRKFWSQDAIQKFENKLGISTRKALQQRGLAELWLLGKHKSGWFFKGQGIHLLPRSSRSAPIPQLPAGWSSLWNTQGKLAWKWKATNLKCYTDGGRKWPQSRIFQAVTGLWLIVQLLCVYKIITINIHTLQNVVKLLTWYSFLWNHIQYL